MTATCASTQLTEKAGTNATDLQNKLNYVECVSHAYRSVPSSQKLVFGRYNRVSHGRRAAGGSGGFASKYCRAPTCRWAGSVFPNWCEYGRAELTRQRHTCPNFMHLFLLLVITYTSNDARFWMSHMPIMSSSCHEISRTVASSARAVGIASFLGMVLPHATETGLAYTVER